MRRRREFLTATGAVLVGAALEGCSLEPGTRSAAGAPLPAARATLQLAPVHASPDRITRITVCTRPFRARGPRLDVERVGDKTVVHNYGHGGSGWSLSWGSSAIAAEKALATGEREFAVIGCGALGLTSALSLQRAGGRVTIYAKDLPPNVRSSLATGVWSPDSRICLDEHATADFRQLWERMARRSFDTYQTLLGLPGDPVEFIDNYFVSDDTSRPRPAAPAPDPRPKFAELESALLGDLTPPFEEFAPGTHSLGARYLRRRPLLMYNLSAYARMLMADFRENGGQIQIAEFHAPADFARLREKTLINATGYGARALFDDQSITPVRGQLARLIPQADVSYALLYQDTYFVPRRDGLVFQVVGEDDYYGFGDDTTLPDRAEALHAVATIASLFRAT